MASIRKRSNKDGSTSYRVDVRLKGVPPQRATFKRLTDARKWAQQTESAIQEGRYFKTIESKRHTLKELIARYERDVLTDSTKKRGKYKAQLRWWKDEIGDYLLADVTPSLIGECRDKLGKEKTPRGTPRSPATVNRYLAALSHALSIAVREWGWLDDSPMRKVSRPTEPRGRVRFLSDDHEGPNGETIAGERTRLLKACKESRNPSLYPIVVLALSTGMRQGEILGLSWEDIDLVKGRITLHETKNGERRVVPLAGHARVLASEHSKVRRIDTSLAFPGKHKPKQPMDIRSSWEAALKEADINDFRFHDLRHSAASYLAMNGATLAEIADVLGHKTLQMVKRYAHLSEAHTTSVVAAMNDRIFKES